MAELTEFIAGAGVRLAIASEARRDVFCVTSLDAGQHDVGEQGRENAALRGAGLGAHERTFGQNTRLQECSHESRHTPVRDTPPKACHDAVVIDVVEATLDVPFNDPLIWRTGPIGFGLLTDRADRVPDMLQSITTCPFRAKAVRDGQEPRLEDRRRNGTRLRTDFRRERPRFAR